MSHSPHPRQAAEHLFRVAVQGDFKLADQPTAPPPGTASRDALKQALKQQCARIDELQRQLYAEHRRALLLIFQGMDAAGKDSTIRKVFRKVDPAGISVHAFKQPSTEELDHDFLWRTTRRLPRRGHIGVFNRSYYEELLIVRVHPQLLQHQQLSADIDRAGIWAEREESIRAHECHLQRNGTRVVKFWLHVSAQVQRERFMARLEHPEKHHKFSLLDVARLGAVVRHPGGRQAFHAAQCGARGRGRTGTHEPAVPARAAGGPRRPGRGAPLAGAINVRGLTGPGVTARPRCCRTAVAGERGRGRPGRGI